MPLADSIADLRDRSLVDLRSAHDYFSDTKNAWSVVDLSIQHGNKYSFRNLTTGSVTTEAELTNKVRGYIRQHTESTFQQFVGVFESFLFDLLECWLVNYPKSMGNKQLDFKTVLDASSRDEIILRMVQKELNELKYKRPVDWFNYLNDRVNLGCPSVTEVEQISEIKAARDVLVHNRGIIGKEYVSKAGHLARYELGKQIEIPTSYHTKSWKLLYKVVDDISTAAIARASLSDPST